MDAPANTKLEVIARIAAQSRAIREIGVRRLGLFGSFLNGTPRHDSDVDLLVEFDPVRKNFDNFWELSQLLERTLSRPVDLLTKESLSPHFGPRILTQVEYVPLAE